MSGPGLLDLLGGWQPLSGPAIGAAASAVLYVVAVRRCGGRWPRWRAACFLAGLALAAWALAGGIDAWSERLLSVHMVQHLVLGLVAAPLLVAGAPERLALRTLRGRMRRGLVRTLHGRVARVALHPACGASAFAAATLATHLTGWFSLALRSAPAHDALHLVNLAAGVLLFASLERAGAIARLVALTAAMVPMGVVGAWLAWAASPRYPGYAGPGAMADQATAAGIMWGCGSLLVAVGAVALAGLALWRDELRQRRREALSG